MAEDTESPLPDRLTSELSDREKAMALLSKLEEQNRLLEEDSRSRTMVSPTTSSSSLHSQPHELSLKSHDQLSSKDSLREEETTHVVSTTLPTTEPVTQPSTSHHGNDLSPQTTSPSLGTQLSADMASSEGTAPSEEATPPKVSPPTSMTISSPSPVLFSGPSHLLPSPTEVRSKPRSSAYSSTSHSQPEGEREEEEEGEGLGPEASVMLGDDLETRIPYHEQPFSSSLETWKETENSAVQVVSDHGMRTSVGEDPFSPEEEGDTRPRPHNDDSGHVTAAGTEEVPQLEPADSEARDMVMELPSLGTPQLGRGKRSRSETESKGTKVNLLSFKGRKRSHTLQEGSMAKEKEEPEEVDDRLLSEETQWQQWSDILKNWEEVFPKNSKLVKQLARQGIPEHLRPMAWQLLSNGTSTELKERYPVLITEPSPHERAIRRDLNRTFPEHEFFKKHDGLGQESLCNVLKAYSVYDKEVGYCQGSPFVAGMLLMQMPEEEAFCVLVQLMHSFKMRDLYKPSMADLSLCFYQLDKLLEEMFPALAMHFKAVGFQPSMYASPWFLTLFASVLSLNLAFRVMDLLLVEGREIVFRVGLAILEASQQQLLQMDMEDMIKHFQKGMKAVFEEDPDQLISRAVKIKLNAKKMKKFGKEYLDKKARKTLEITEMARLQSENMEANQKLMKLQQEFDTLKEELISGNIQRAQDGAEIAQLRNELAITRKKLAKLESQGMDGDHAQREQNTEAVPEWAETNGNQSGLESNMSRAFGVRSRSSSDPPLDIPSATPPIPRDTFPPRSLHLAGKQQSLSNPTLFDIYKDSSVSPEDSPIIHGTLHNRGSKENLFHTEEHPGLNTASSVQGTPEEPAKKKKKKRLLKRSKSEKAGKKSQIVKNLIEHAPPSRAYSQEHDSTETPPPLSPDSYKSKKEGKKKKDKHREHEHELEQALAMSKLTCADYANQLEVKGLELQKKCTELSQALQREAFLIREIKQGRQFLDQLEAKLSSSPEVCPQCQQAGRGGPSPSQEEGSGPNSTQALLTNLRAIWKSSPLQTRKELT